VTQVSEPGTLALLLTALGRHRVFIRALPAAALPGFLILFSARHLRTDFSLSATLTCVG
jgi:hypothetical protein